MEKALAVRAEMTEMVNDLQTKGYHEFANGNVISNYIYTKKVHLSSPLTFDPDESNPSDECLHLKVLICAPAK